MYTVQKASQGIILRSELPTRSKVMLLDNVRGKVVCIPRKQKSPHRLVHGMLTEYALERWRDVFILSYGEPLAMPQAWVIEDILFLHQVLELCAAYIPLEHEAPMVFNLLLTLYTAHKVPSNPPLFKKLLLCKLLTLLGIYPDEAACDASLLSLISSGNDVLMEAPANTEHEERLTEWLIRSLQMSPTARFLKTFSYGVLGGTL